MQPTRREFLTTAAGAAFCCASPAGSACRAAAAQAPAALPIIDTHQHLWDLAELNPPWLERASEVLRKRYHVQEYRAATEGLQVQAIYMEIDSAPAQQVAEAEHVIRLCHGGQAPTIAAVIGGHPAAPDFAGYLDRFRGSPYVKGLRQVLHGGGTPAGYCLQEAFVAGIHELGRRGLSFDLCLRPGELADAVKLVGLCPDTRFVVDHCGNADPKAFGRRAADAAAPSHDPQTWRRDMAALAGRKNVICKISGVVARAPQGWSPDDLAPIVNHCLDEFGPDRVVFGGDWPVCLQGATLRQWIDALREIVSSRPPAEQRKLWSENARRFYTLDAPRP